MRKKIFWMAGLLSFLIIISCQRENALILNNQIMAEKVAATKVNAWLEMQKQASSESGAKKLQPLINLMQLSKLRIEQLNDKKRMFIIPVDASVQTEMNKGKNAVNVLLFFEDEKGNISNGYLVQFIPELGKNISELPANSFFSIYNNKINPKGNEIPNGTFSYFNVYSTFQYEGTYNNGSLKGAKGYQKSKKASDENNTAGCIDWDLVTWIFNSDGLKETSGVYFASSCNPSCTPWLACYNKYVLEGF